MNRRHFLKNVAGAGAVCSAGSLVTAIAAENPAAKVPEPRTDVTSGIADFIVRTKYPDLPPELIDLGKKSMLDAFGLAIVGAQSKGSRILQTYLGNLGCTNGAARVLGTKQRQPLRFAALANAVSIHMEDFDDTQLPVPNDPDFGQVIHPTAPVFPVAAGLADTRVVSGKEFILAFHVGAEVACKIADACASRAYKAGFHASGIFGAFGSAAAIAKLRGFDARVTGNALALAASQASGLAENFGTLTKPFQVGHAAEAGVVAADLAELGWDGSRNVLEAANGFFHAYGGSYQPSYLVNKLGLPWSFVAPGVAIKPYPSGAVSHPAMTEIARLLSVEGIKPDEVRQIEAGTSSLIPQYLRYHEPRTGLEGKFSMEFCLAVLLLTGKAGLGEFTDAVVGRRDVREMMSRIRFYVDPEAEAPNQSRNTTFLKVHLKDGRTFASKVEYGKGSPINPMSYDEVAEKFLGCTNYAQWPAKKAERIIGLVRNLENLRDVATLTELGAA